MDDTMPKVDNKEIDNNISMSADDNKTKYYEGNDKNFISEISQDNKEDIKDKAFKINTSCSNKESKIFKDGEIVVTSILECKEHECLKGVKINLYKINGLSPVLIKSEITNENGNVVFSEVEEGCYRIIEIVDKRYFEKPKYINWNEITIDCVNKNQKIIIVNKIKRFVSQNKHKHWI